MPEPSESSKRSSLLEKRYAEQRQRITSLYEDVSVWHGSGRYELNETGEIIDILEGVAAANALNTHNDEWDTSLGEVASISTTNIRPYAAGYADMHQLVGEELEYRDSRSNPTWIMRALRKIILQSPAAAVSFIRNMRKLNNKISAGDADAWIARKTGDSQVSGDQKASEFLHRRSQISGNYSILWGVKSGSFEPVKTAKFVEKTEKRANTPIALDDVTHVEVPFAYISETQEVFDRHGITLPIIPRELGERYSSEFSDRQLITGSGFKKQVARSITRYLQKR
jgi:hypothetical protein